MTRVARSQDVPEFPRTPALRSNESLPNSDLEVVVPPGAPLPLSVLHADTALDTSTELTTSQQELAHQQAEDFIREAALNNPQIHDGSANDEQADAKALGWWQNAAARADERFRALLGHDSYNREVIRQHQFNKQTLPTN